MDAFQIAKYALIQVTALVYAVLVSTAAVKFMDDRAANGFPLPSSYFWAVFMRDYGMIFFLPIVAWTARLAYISVVRADEPSDWWIRSAVGTCAMLFGGSTVIAIVSFIRYFS